MAVLMNFDLLAPINESVEFMLKNFIDVMLYGSTSDGIYSLEKKLERIEEAYFTYYKLDKETNIKASEYLRNFIEKNKNKFDVLDAVKLEKYWHIRLNIDINYGKYFKKRNRDLYHIYSYLFRTQFKDGFPDIMSKYTYPAFIDNKYFIFITFDEKDIKAVQTIVTENMLDQTSSMWLETVKMDKSIFKK